MTTLHLIHGFVGVGKTTFSKKLAKEKNIVRFNLDDWMIALFGQNPRKEEFVLYESRIKNQIWKMAKEILLTGNDVILDFGFWKKAERSKYRNLAKKINVKVKLYNLQCPEDVIVKRVLNRTKKMPKNALFIDQNAISEFRKYYEPIGKNEDAISVLTNKSKAKRI